MGGRVTSLAPGGAARSFRSLKMKGGADRVHFDLQNIYILPLKFMGWSNFSAGSEEACGFRGGFFR